MVRFTLQLTGDKTNASAVEVDLTPTTTIADLRKVALNRLSLDPSKEIRLVANHNMLTEDMWTLEVAGIVDGTRVVVIGTVLAQPKVASPKPTQPTSSTASTQQSAQLTTVLFSIPGFPRILPLLRQDPNLCIPFLKSVRTHHVDVYRAIVTNMHEFLRIVTGDDIILPPMASRPGSALTPEQKRKLEQEDEAAIATLMEMGIPRDRATLYYMRSGRNLERAAAMHFFA